MASTYTLCYITSCCAMVFGLTPTTAQTQNALDFDGVNDLVRVPAASTQLVGATSCSLTCWVYPRNAAPAYPDFDGFAGFRNEVDADFYLLQIAPFNTIEGRLQNSDEEVFTVTYGGLVLNTWQHLGLVYNGSMLAIWYNGVEVASVPANGIITDASVPFYVGNVQFQSVPFLLNGRMDEVALFTRALVADEMECLMASGPSITDPDLALYYRCDQGTPGGNNTAISTLTDLTGQVNGNLEGFALTGATSNFVQGMFFGTTIEDVWCDDQIAFQFGDEVVNGPGSYTATFTSSSGCDSTVVLNMFQGEVNTNVVQNGSLLISTANPATWQWVDCDNNNAPIPGATGQYFQATAVGNYAVIVTQGCSAMSDCREVTVVGIGEHDRTFVSLSPVPASEALNVELATTSQPVRVTVIDMSGREVQQNTFANTGRVRLDIASLSEGTYFLRIEAEERTNVLRFVKE
ncbi:MAG: T9SS type A sorting domain-containing protein [Flavobacteriales bacterium]|nr:T9SS type A sorting domain-containing protein [Flavobacteriales bacterium]